MLLTDLTPLLETDLCGDLGKLDGVFFRFAHSHWIVELDVLGVELDMRKSHARRLDRDWARLADGD